MATLFAESFDPYLAVVDGTNSGVWTTLGGGLSASTQFGQGQSHNGGASVANFPSSEGTIYGSIRLIVTGAASATNYFSLTFTDSGTAQCTIRWNTDGSIGLYQGVATGLLFQTYAGVFVRNLWASFQFKVVFDGVVGSIELRMNGSTTNLVTKTGIATRVTANNTANGFSYTNASGSPLVDDLYFNNISGNNPVSWLGDLRAIQQTPAIATQTQFSKIPAIATQTIVPTFNSGLFSGNVVTYIQFRPTTSGLINTVTFNLPSGAAATNIKIAIYDSSALGGAPGNVLATSNLIASPGAGAQVASFVTPATVLSGSTYYVAYNQDNPVTYLYDYETYIFRYISNTPFSSFPVSNPPALSGPNASSPVPNTILSYTCDNAASIQDLIEDGDTSYNYAITPSEDKYSMKSIPTGYTVVAMQYYVMWRKSDAGSRTAQLSVAANGSADTPLITNSSLPTTVYQFQFTTKELDPTGVAWTPTNVNSSVLGIAVTA